MRKHIGTKVISMLIVLVAIFIVNALLNSFSTSQSQDALQTIAETYMQIQESNGALGKAVEDCKLYGNLIIIKEDESAMKDIENSVSELNDTIDTSFETMKNLCAEAGNDELVELLEGYDEETEKLQELISQIVEASLDGDKAKAIGLSNGIYAQTAVIGEKADEFNNLLHQSANGLTVERQSRIDKLSSITAVMSVIYLLVSVFMIFVVNQSVAKPAKSASGHLHRIITKIENNEGDLTERIEVKTQDEVGQLVQGVNNFIGELQEVMQKIRRESLNMNDLVNNITDGINSSNESAGSVSAAMEELSASMEEVAATISQITVGAQEISDAAKSMSLKAENGAGLISEIKVRAEDVKALASDSKETTNRMLQDIRQLLEQAIENSRSVEKINGLTGEILSISSQTNLLALNASIEAARAGEAGKGFAVVADEIRVLADNSRSTANNIQDISVLVTQAVEELSDHANEMLKFIDSTVLSDYDKFVDMANQYHSDADNMDDILHEFYDRSQALADTMSKMTEGIDGINVAVDESAQGVTVAAQSTSELVEALVSIKSQSDANKEISEQLQDTVKRFKNI